MSDEQGSKLEQRKRHHRVRGGLEKLYSQLGGVYGPNREDGPLRKLSRQRRDGYNKQCNALGVQTAVGIQENRGLNTPNETELADSLFTIDKVEVSPMRSNAGQGQSSSFC